MPGRRREEDFLNSGMPREDRRILDVFRALAKENNNLFQDLFYESYQAQISSYPVISMILTKFLVKSPGFVITTEFASGPLYIISGCLEDSSVSLIEVLQTRRSGTAVTNF